SIRRAIVSGIWISDAARRSNRCRVSDRTRGGGADRAGCFIGNFAASRHLNSVVDIAGAGGSKTGCAATSSGSIGYSGERAREVILHHRAASVARPNVGEDNRVGALTASNRSCFAIRNCHLQVGFEGNRVGVRSAVVCSVRIGHRLGSRYRGSVYESSGRSRAELTLRSIGDLAAGGHVTGVIDTPGPAGRESS